jgi:hypothetical protein
MRREVSTDHRDVMVEMKDTSSFTLRANNVVGPSSMHAKKSVGEDLAACPSPTH